MGPHDDSGDVAAIVGRHGHGPEHLLPILRDLDVARSGVNRSTVHAVARSLNLPAQQVEGVARFYSMLGEERAPRREVRVCRGVACRLACDAGDITDGITSGSNHDGWTMAAAFGRAGPKW